MERFPLQQNPEEKEQKIERTNEQIEQLIEGLATKEGMAPEDIEGDIVVFALVEGNESANPDYLDELADRLQISSEEMRKYAKTRYEEFNSQIEKE